MKKGNSKDSKKKDNPKKGKNKANKKDHKKLRVFMMALFIIVFLAIIVISAIVVGSFKVAMQEFDTDDLIIGKSNSTIVDSEGNVLATLNGDEKRKIISKDDMGPYLPNAYVAIEDERFYQHDGVDFKRTGAAIFNYVTRRGSTSFGGSTITQQLVKNATEDKEKTIDRKIKEWARAYKVESIFSKDQILETYLNIIFVGSDLYGVELGSKYYFNKSAKELSLAECAFMAGINNSPNAYKPFADDPEGKNKDKINKRTKTVLTKMKELDYIKEDEYNNAIAEVDNGLAFSKGESIGNIYSYHTDALISSVIQDLSKEKGISKSLATNYLYGSGLTIYSTQVASIQNRMEEEYNKEKYIEKSREKEGAIAQSAMVIMDHKTGYVVGCVGGIGQKSTSRGLNRATQLPRQTGSSFKPLAVVGPALQEGIITATSIYDDVQTTFPGGYTPKNYNYFRGRITVRQALETSQNIPFIKIMQELKVDKSKEYLEKMGITTLTKDDCNLSMAIGGLSLGVSTLEMCGAYATIANNGEYIEPIFYSKIEDSKGNIVIEKKQERHRVFDEDKDYILKSLLQEPVYGAQGTAKYCGIPNIHVAAKTGTTNKDNDRWLCGFTPYYTACVWYGYDEAEKVRSGSNPSGLIWSAVMHDIHANLPAKNFDIPKGIITTTICRDTGLCASESCTNIIVEGFVSGTIPGVCPGHVVEPTPEPEIVEEPTQTEQTNTTNQDSSQVNNTVNNSTSTENTNTTSQNTASSTGGNTAVSAPVTNTTPPSSGNTANNQAPTSTGATDNSTSNAV